MLKTYVMGHRHPDTDSIASAVAYADLLRQTRTGEFIAVRCGDLNAETRYVLQTLDIQAPVLMENVESQVSDIPFLYPQSAPYDMPAIDVASLMEEHDVRNIPIVNEDGRLLGLVSEHGLARAYVTPHASTQLTVGPIGLVTLARILQADLVSEAGPERLLGNVSIVIDALHVSLSRLGPDDIAVVGDNEPAQLALVSAGIAALIIAQDAPMGERIIKAALDSNVSLIRTPLDAFSVSRMIHLSHPAERLMATDVQTVRLEESIGTATRVVTNSPYRTACVIDADGNLLGMISRNTFLEEIHKSVILVDHNEFAQAVEGIETADILEIIDHHRLGAITTLRPIQFRNEPVGSTSTIITTMYQEAGIVPSESVAGLLLAGILSDTLVLKMSTTTEKDHNAVTYLSSLTDLSPFEFGTTLIQSGMDLSDVPLEELLTRDTKPYTLFDTSVIIAQIMTASDEYHLTHHEDIKKETEQLRVRHGVDIYMVMFTDVINQVSYLFAAGNQILLDELGYSVQPVRLSGVMSRKKDLLPVFGQRLRSLQS